MQAFEERHGVHIVQAWGMTETSPLASVARPPAGAEGEEHWAYRSTAGPARCRSSRRASSPATAAMAPWDGETTGELEVRGPWIAGRVLRGPGRRREVPRRLAAHRRHRARSTRDGYIRITDRSKDVIKSGGEWISSVELESELMAHPAVAEAAVIAMPRRALDRAAARLRGARPRAQSATAEELREHLRSRVAKWWLPDEFAFIDEVPKTSVGKFDKKVAARAGSRRASSRTA